MEISSSGREIVVLSMVPSMRLVLNLRVGEGGETSCRLVRFVKALASAMIYFRASSFYVLMYVCV